VLNPFTADLDNTLHEHLEMENADVTVYINAFEIPVPKDMYHVVLGKIDPQGKITYNKQEFFFDEEQLNTVCDFFGNVKRKLRMNNSHALVEQFRLNWLADEEKQESFVEDDTDHVDNNRINLFRDIQDSTTIKLKMRTSKDYCKRFYATLCNNQLHKDGQVISYSWRSTGGLVADILCTGDYLDWYCSGNEGWIDTEVQQDLAVLKWEVKHYPDEEEDTTGDLF